MTGAPLDPSTARLTCRGLTVRRGGTEVVRGVDLSLHAGEVVALLGPNGAGKSTLLDALAGALAAAAGEVTRSGRVALALQSPDLARRSVLDNVTLALSWWGVPRRERAPRALEALRAIGAEHLAARAATALSGGERRRVHLARTLALAPDVLLLDEPFAGLDPEARAGLLEDAAAAIRRPGQATLVVVHDRAEAWALADRLLIMIDGALVAVGPPRELLERPPNEGVARFLGFDGSLSVPGGRLLTRPAHVIIDPAGDHEGRVVRAIPLEDGARLELALDGGHVFAIAPVAGPRVGERIRFRVHGGVRVDRPARP